MAARARTHAGMRENIQNAGAAEAMQNRITNNSLPN
jgi:type IV secretion system protein VirB6